MSTTPLVIQTKVDLSGFQQFTGAAASVQTATEQMAQKFAAAGLSANEVKSALQNMGISAGEAAAAVQSMGTAAEEAGARTTRSLTDARFAAQLLGQELGVHIPRAMTTLLARSETLGPALNAAFAGIAIAGFIELAVQAGEKLANLISETYIFTKAQQDLYNQLRRDNVSIAADNEQQKKDQRDIALIGLDQVDAARLRLQYSEQDADAAKERLGTTQNELSNARAQVNALAAQAEQLRNMPQSTAVGRGIVPSNAARQLADVQTQLETATQRVTALSSSFAVLQKDSAVAGDQVEASAKKLADALREAGGKYAELLASTFEQGAEYSEKMAKADLEAVTKDMEAREKAAKEQIDFSTEVSEKQIEQEQKAAEESARKRAEIFNQENNEELQIAIENAKRKAEAENVAAKSAGGLGPTAGLDARRAAIDEEYEAEREAVLKRISLLDGENAADVAKAQELSQKLIQLKQQQVDAQAKLDQEYQAKFQQVATGIINGPFDTMINALIAGKEKVGLIFEQMGASLLSSLTRTLANMALQWIEHWAIVKAETLLGIAQTNAATASGNAAKAALTSATNTSIAISEAGVAAAGAFASAMVALPFPVNVSVAPEAAAGALATGLSFASVAAQEEGGFTLGTGLSLLHPSEITMPADVSQAFRNIQAAGANPATAGGSGGGSAIFAPTIHALDAEGVDRVLAKHQRLFQKHAAKWLRNGALSR